MAFHKLCVLLAVYEGNKHSTTEAILMKHIVLFTLGQRSSKTIETAYTAL